MQVEFETKIYNNRVDILKAIFRIPREKIRNVYHCRCTESNDDHKTENPAEYIRQFKTAKDVLESHIVGALVYTKYVTGMP